MGRCQWRWREEALRERVMPRGFGRGPRAMRTRVGSMVRLGWRAEV